jgi:uncharacterized protein
MADTSNRGFASMDDKKQRDIASLGGKAAHDKGTAHEFNSTEAQRAGRKGGEVVSEDREHMAEIGRKGGEARADDPDIKSGETGRKGGEAVSKDREHMAEIGRKGGQARADDPDIQSGETGRKGGNASHGGSHEQHVKAGQQSHKND